MPIASIVSAILALAKVGIDRQQAETQRALDQKYNEEQAKINRDWQHNERLETQDFYRDLFEESNEYNSIGSQIVRGRGAGVSPSAIIGGKISDATASPAMSSFGSGAQASTNIGSSVLSALSGSLPSMLNSTGQFVKNMTDSFIARDTLGLNKELLRSQVKSNIGSFQKALADVGVANATEQQIYETIRWMEPLNTVQIQDKLTTMEKTRNESYAVIQQILESKYRIKESISRTLYNQALTGNVREDTRSMIIENTYLNDMMSARVTNQELHNELIGQQITAEELDNADRELRLKIANELNIPLGSSEHELLYMIWLRGQLTSYCDDAIAPYSQAHMKPSDLRVPATHIKGRYIPSKGIFGSSSGLEDTLTNGVSMLLERLFNVVPW